MTGSHGWSRRTFLAALGTLPFSSVTGGLAAQREDFASWLQSLKQEARAKGISRATLDSALRDLRPNPRVLELDRRQPEYSQTFWSYLTRAASESRVKGGRARLARHRALLQRVAARYGVQPRILVALWGMESSFGDFTGGFPVIGSLATLAYDPRRAELFRTQLIAALRILDQGHVPLGRMTGSWAGAMGQVQFLPTTFTDHAVDADGDGRRDIWNSLPDVFSSAANYLRHLGWRSDQTWGREVRLPSGFDWSLANLENVLPLRQWAGLGVRAADGGPLPLADFGGAIILPGGYQGPAFMVYDNYRVILGWNRSISYAVAVGHLSDRIRGRGPLIARPPANDRPLSRVEIEEIQTRLTRLGFAPGTADGVVGAQTRAAIRTYQQQVRLPPDGYPTVGLLRRLRQGGQGGG